jgi:hypothetical protein
MAGTGVSGGAGGTGTYVYPPGQKPWWQYPFSAGYSGTEPYGGGPKPDINIGVPLNTAIVAPASGTVTYVDTSSPWGNAVTIKMDSPYNPVATHYAILHMTSIDPSIQQGQHVNAGQLLGVGGGNNTPSGTQQAPIGFAFYNGDQYGYGSTWNQYVGSSALDPTRFLTSLAGSSTLPNALSSGNANWTAQGGQDNSGGLCATPIIGPLICFIQQSAKTVAFFILGLVFIIIGFVILIHPNPEDALKVAEVAA